jgi:hypothetical protein
VGARASLWSAGINPPRSNCLDGARGALQPRAWYAFTLRTRHAVAAVKWGEAPRYVLELCSHVATRGRPDALTADGRLTVKASSSAAAEHGVRPSATRHALVGLRRREGIALPACTEPRQTGSPAVTVQRVVLGHALGGSMYSRADATHAFAELTDALVCESSLRHKADV